MLLIVFFLFLFLLFFFFLEQASSCHFFGSVWEVNFVFLVLCWGCAGHGGHGFDPDTQCRWASPAAKGYNLERTTSSSRHFTFAFTPDWYLVPVTLHLQLCGGRGRVGRTPGPQRP